MTVLAEKSSQLPSQPSGALATNFDSSRRLDGLCKVCARLAVWCAEDRETTSEIPWGESTETSTGKVIKSQSLIVNGLGFFSTFSPSIYSAAGPLYLITSCWIPPISLQRSGRPIRGPSLPVFCLPDAPGPGHVAV